MSNSQEIKDAADAVLAATAAFAAVQEDINEMSSDLNALLDAAPERAALIAASAAFDVVLEAAKVTVNFDARQAAYDTAAAARLAAIDNLSQVIVGYDQT